MSTRLRDIPRFGTAVVSRYDYDANNNLIYAGYADTGTATSASGWYVEKYTYDANGNVTTIQTAPWPSIWDNRTSLTYT